MLSFCSSYIYINCPGYIYAIKAYWIELNWIELSLCGSQKRTVQKSKEEKPKPKKDSDIVRERIIRRAALEFEDGMYGILFWKEYEQIMKSYCFVLQVPSFT